MKAKPGNGSSEKNTVEAETQRRIDDIMNRKGTAMEVLEGMRRNEQIRRGMVEEVTRDQVGRKNENMIFITMYTLALLGIHAL